MRLSPVKNIAFKGYDAQPLRALYMQNGKTKTQQMIFRELSDISKMEHFDVFVHTEDGLKTDVSNLNDTKNGDYNYWSQDNKLFIQKNGVDTVIYPKLFRDSQNLEAIKLAKEENMPTKESELILEGGNMFLGKKPDDKNYLIVGEDTLETSAVYQFLKDRGVKKLNDDKLTDFLMSGHVYTSIGFDAQLIRSREYYDEQDYWKNIATKMFLEEFDVEEDDFCVISQPNYHIDLAIRPLEYPYVLVDDMELDKENLMLLEEEFGHDAEKFTKQFKKEQRRLKNLYVSCDKTAKQLREKGFVPIFIGGGFGACKVNFMNAIVNKRASGQLSYITNSTECENEKYEFLQRLFEADLREKYPKIDRFYFVKGGDYKDGNNVLMSYLKKFSGGIHCLCAERPIFENK